MKKILTSIILFMFIISSIDTSSAASKELPHQSSGIIQTIEEKLSAFFAYIGSFFSKPDGDPLLPPAPKDAAELIRKDAHVSDKLRAEFHGPKQADKKPSINLEEIEDAIAPLPKVEELSEADDSKNLPIRQDIAKGTALDNLENESQRIKEIDDKLAADMPPLDVDNTISENKSTSLEQLETQFTLGDVPKTQG